MERIVQITGNVSYPITLDPSVWIFDERKKKLTEFFAAPAEVADALEAYTKAISAQWDKEVTEGNNAPSPNKNKATFSKKKEWLSETYGISLGHFLANSAPSDHAETLLVHTDEGTYEFPLSAASSFVLCFSEKGKALTGDDGPIHLYHRGTMDERIKGVRLFEIR
ncbi:MAG: peptidyl-prolyl cis-trans isomerase [Bacillus sp. (in: firmicutes)]